MKLDDIDIKILKFLGKLKKPVTTTDMAKELFALKDEYDLKKKDNFIRLRLKRLLKAGLVIGKEENNHTNYVLCADCIVISGLPRISINGTVFKGQKGDYVFIIKGGFLEQILS